MPRKYIKKPPKIFDDTVLTAAAYEVINLKMSILHTAKKFNTTQAALRRKVRTIRGHRKRFSYTHETLEAAVQHLIIGSHSLSWVSRHYGIPRSTLSARLKSDRPLERKLTGKGTALPRREEEAIKKWILEMGRKEGTQAWQTIARTVQEVLNERGLKIFKNDNKPTSGWLQAFLRRHPELRKIRIGYWTTGIVEDVAHTNSGVNVDVSNFGPHDPGTYAEEELEESLRDIEASLEIKTEIMEDPPSEDEKYLVECRISSEDEIADPIKNNRFRHFLDINEFDSYEETTKDSMQCDDEIYDYADVHDFSIVRDIPKQIPYSGNMFGSPSQAEESGKASEAVSAAIAGNGDVGLGGCDADVRKLIVGNKSLAVNVGRIFESSEGITRIGKKTGVGKENLGAREKIGFEDKKTDESTCPKDEKTIAEAGTGSPAASGVTAMDINTADGKSIKIMLKGFRKPNDTKEKPSEIKGSEQIMKFMLVSNPKGSSIPKSRFILPKPADTNSEGKGVGYLQNKPSALKNTLRENNSIENSSKTSGPMNLEDDKHSKLTSHIRKSSLKQKVPSMENVQVSPQKQSGTNLEIEDIDLLRDLEASAFHVQEPETPDEQKKRLKTVRIPKTIFKKANTKNRKITKKDSAQQKKPRLRVKTASSLMVAPDYPTTSEEPTRVNNLDVGPLPPTLSNDNHQKHSREYNKGLLAMFNAITEEINPEKLTLWSKEGGQLDDPLFCIYKRAKALLFEAKCSPLPIHNDSLSSAKTLPVMEVDVSEAQYIYNTNDKPQGTVENSSCQMPDEEYMMLQESLWEEDVKPDIEEDVKPLPELVVEPMEPHEMETTPHHSNSESDEAEVRLSGRQKRKIKPTCPCCV